jgi:hypothetical protein
VHAGLPAPSADLNARSMSAVSGLAPSKLCSCAQAEAGMAGGGRVSDLSPLAA